MIFSTTLLLATMIHVCTCQINAEDKADTSLAEIKNIFKQEYDDPIIEEQELPAYFAGLRYFSVFDRHQLVEDPLIPSLWLVTPVLKKYRIPISEEIPEILSEIKYVPSSAGEALDAAEYIAEWSCRWARTISDIDSANWRETIKSSKLDFSQAKNPAVTRTDSSYVVISYLYLPKVEIFHVEIQPWEVLIKFTCEIGKGLYRIEKQEIDASYMKEK